MTETNAEIVSGSGRTVATVALTHRSVEALQPKASPYRVVDARCAGLGVRVATSGAKTWDLVYRIHKTGQVKRRSLGRVHDVSLEEARSRANQITAAARQGRDLLAEETAAVEAAEARITVEQLIEVYMRRSVNGRLRSAKDIERRLRKTLAPVFDKAAADLRRREIRALLDAVADDGYRGEAEQRRTTLSGMFRWAVGQDFIVTNPAYGLASYGRSTGRERVLSADEIATLWAWLNSTAIAQPFAEILKLQLLIGARCSEISGLVAQEINRTHWIWTLPAERSKNGRPRLTPIVGLARKLLDARLDITSSGPLYVTRNGLPFQSTHLGNALAGRRRQLPIAKFTTHDLRRTVVTMLTELGTPLELVAAIVGHEMGGPELRTLIKYYVRTDLLDRKAAALKTWSDWLQQIVGRRRPAKLPPPLVAAESAPEATD